MWVRSTATVPMSAGELTKALGDLTPDRLAALAQEACRDGCHLCAQLARPVRRDDITTLHLRLWNDRDRLLTPAVDGELELRPLGAQSTELAITAQYRCRALYSNWPTRCFCAGWPSPSSRLSSVHSSSTSGRGAPPALTERQHRALTDPACRIKPSPFGLRKSREPRDP